MNERTRIVLVEGVGSFNKALERILRPFDFDVTMATGGQNAIELIDELGPAMILLDPELSDMDGLALLKTLKDRDETKNIVVILVSGDSNSERIIEGLKIGAEDYIEKPFDVTVLRVKLDNQLKWWKARRDVESLNEQLANEKRRIQDERDILARYFSRDLIDALLSGSISTKIGGDVQTASILFCDMRNSTTIAEHIDPASFMDLINNLFTDLTDIVYGEGGSVNKFIGDGILATFGCPRDLDDDALHCANVAVKIRKYLENFNQFRPDYLDEPIEIGIGISRGQIFAGNVGSVYQIQYTVLGDPVNLASRLESLTKRVGVDILIDGNMRDALADQAKVRKVNLTRVRGKLQQVRIYCLDSLM